MRKNDFVHQVVIALARRRDNATAAGLARFADLLASDLAMFAPFDEAPAIDTREAERLTAINEGLRQAVAKTCTVTDALRQENDSLKERAARAEEAQRYAERMLAILVYSIAPLRRAPSPVTVPKAIEEDAMAYIRVGGYASVGHSPNGVTFTFVNAPATKAEVPQ